MLKRHQVVVSIAVLLITSLACAQPGAVASPDPNAASTAIVQTISALQTEGAPSASPVTETSTPELSTATPTLSPTPEFTTTPTTPQISVSFDTFCRVGPGKEYEKVGILLVGETTEIVGRDAVGEFWYVRNPDVGPEFCWMSGEYATISGNYLVLLIQTPPAAAPAEVDMFYDGLDKCTGWSARFRLHNLSGVLFKSMSITVKDTTANEVQSANTNSFTNNSNCSAPDTKDTLVQGASILVSSPEFSYNPNGHTMHATITVCANINLGGTCTTAQIDFKP